MFGLFEYSYDYYEWERLLRVSESPERLEKSLTPEECDPDETAVVRLDTPEGEAAHTDLSNGDIRHYGIRKVEVI